METLDRISALMLDDERESISTAKTKFSKVNIVIQPSLKIEDFEKKEKDYNLIISDLDLKNISKTSDGIKVLIKIRAKNKSAFLVLYSAFLSSLNGEQLNLIKENDIQLYDKKEGVSVQNIRMDYEKFVKTNDNIINFKEDDKNKLMRIHYDVTKSMALKHLNGISPNTTLVPLLKKKKLYPINEMIKEVEADSEIGSLFILQYLDTLLFINSKKSKV